jgi:hypothetical protein
MSWVGALVVNAQLFTTSERVADDPVKLLFLWGVIMVWKGTE